MADLYYYESGYFDPELGYFVYTADAESAITATSSISCDADVIAGGVIVEGSSSWMSNCSMEAVASAIRDSSTAMTSAFTQTITISHIEGADLFAFSEALLAAEVSRIRNNNADLSTQFSSAIDASRIRHISADDMAVSTIFVGNNIRVRFNEAAVNAAFSLAADVELVPGGEVLQAEAALSVSATVDCSAQRKRNIIDCDVTTEFTQSTTAQRLAGLASTQDVSATQSTTADRLRGVTSAINTTATVSAGVNEIVQLVGSLTATANISCVISHIEGADLQAFTNAALSASVDRTRNASASLTAQASVSAGVNEIVQLAGNFSSSFSQNSLAGLAVDVASSISSNFALSTTKYFGSGRPKTLTIPGNSTYFDSTVKKFGSHSLKYQGLILDTQYASTRPVVGQSWVAETWLYRTTTAGDSQSMGFGWLDIATNTSRQVIVAVRDTPSSFAFQRTISTILTASTWTHVAVVSNGSTISVYIGGTRRYTTTSMPASYSNTGQIFFRARDTSASDAGRIDETSVHVGTTLGFDPTQTTITVPTQPRSNDSQYTQVLYHFNNDGVDDTIGIETAQAAITSTSTVTASIKVIPGGVVQAQSQFTLQAQADAAIRSASASLTAQGFVVAVNGRIRPEIADLSSQFVVYANAGVQVDASANLNSNFVLTAQALDLDLAQADLTATTALTFEINVVKSAQSSMTANAVQTTAPVITARITKALTTTATLTASVLDLDIASANLTSSFTLRANANRWYPRPNGYWDTSIEYQQPWANWNRLRIHNLNVNTVGTLIDFGGYIKLTSDGTNISLNGATGFNPTLTYYDVDIFNGSSLILKNPNTGTNEYVLAVDSFNGTKSKTYNSSIPSTADFYWNHTYRVLYNTTNTTWRAICSILGYTLIYRASASGGDVVFLLVESFNSGTGVWSGALGYSYSFTNVVTGPLNYGPNFTFVMTRVNSSTSFTISSDYNNETITHSVSEINDNSGTISAGSYYAYNIPNSGYLTVTSAASDVLLTTSDFNESYIVSTYPYILNDQTGVLGLYDTYGALDRTGLVGQAQAALTSSTTQAINANKLISMSASLSGTFTQVSTVKKIARTPIAVQSTATISPTGARIRFGATALSTTATVSLTAKKYNGFVVNQSSQATVNAVPYDFTKAQAALQVQTSIDPTALRIKQIAADFTAFYSEVTAAFKNATGTILMESTATITCDARKITDSPQYMFVNANLTAQGINTLFGSSSLSSTTAFSLTPTYLRRNESAMSVSTSLVANNVRTRGLSSTQSSQFYQFAYTETSKIVGYASTMLSASALVANNQILRLAQADLASEFTTPYIYAGVLVRIEADLQVNAFTLTAGRVINIDPYYQLLIARETRTLEVHRENRVIRVNSETRVNKIKGYPTI